MMHKLEHETAPPQVAGALHKTNNAELPAHYRGQTLLPITRKRGIDARLITLLKPDAMESTRYQRLRLAVENLKSGESAVVVGITSPVAGEGKTLTSINLAGALARNPDSRVLLIEMDLRHPAACLKDYLGLKRWSPPGVVDSVLAGVTDWEQSVSFIPEFNLYVMPSGRSTASAYEILNSVHLERLLAEARNRFDFIVVDTAPVTITTDASLIAKWLDKFLVVVASGKTSKKALEECLDLMAPDQVLGLIFNLSTNSGTDYNGY